MVEGGCVIANGGDVYVKQLVETERATLEAKNIKITYVDVSREAPASLPFTLAIPGAMNRQNAAMCYAAAECLGAAPASIVKALADFRGVWRRLEKVRDEQNLVVYSDYGHHPTAVTKTLEAVKEFYPGRRIVLCFQPHHRNRTRHLFLEFVSCFDLADELILCEIYDVAGRNHEEDESVSSQDLVQAIQHHDADRGSARKAIYAVHPAATLVEVQKLLRADDVVVVMGAGDLYKIAKEITL